jgi:signal transduction histidine kinase
VHYGDVVSSVARVPVVARLPGAPAAPPTRRQAAVIAGTGAAAIAFSLLMISTGWQGYHQRVWMYWLAAPVGLSFIVAGLVAWWRWPANRTGVLMVAGGASWYLTSLQDLGNPVLFAVGYILTYFDLALFTHVVLVYPEGRITRRVDRWVLAANYTLYLVLQTTRYLLYGQDGPIGPRPGHHSAFGDVISIDALIFSVIVGVLLLHRWLAASPPARRVHAPVWLGVIVLDLVGLLGALGSLLRWPATLQAMLVVGYGLFLVALPFAFLSGLVRIRLARVRVADLVVELGRAGDPGQVRHLLAWALSDPTLVLGFWSDAEAGYLDPDGRPVTVGGLPADRAVTRVDGEARPLAVLVHDAALADQPALIDAAVAALRLALENAAARTSAALAALEERRKIERDLHDGVQQRLLRLTWLAKQARTLAPPDVAPVLDELAEEARGTFAELREVARGIHPSLVTERGLAEAVEEYSLRSPVPVEVDLPAGRWPAPVEITAFFVISEAVVNAVRHAGVDRVAVSGRVLGGRLVVEVTDGGCGGADPGRGSGLRGLRDRVTALGGTLTVRSVPGHGTRIRAELPCG